MAKTLRELYEESLSGKFTRVYDVFGSGPSQETVVLAGQTHIPAPVEGDGPFEKFDDGLIRGGLYNAIAATALDEVRLGKFLLSTNGVLSLVKQSGLQLSNPNTSFSIATSDPKTISTQLFDYTGPLAAAGGNAFGLHFDRHGLIPNLETDSYKIPGSYLNSNTQEGKFVSRLELYKNKMNDSSSGGWELYKYNGGPDSYLGLGTTKVVVGSNSFGLNDVVTNKTNFNSSDLGFKPWSYKNIQGYSDSDTKNSLTKTSITNLAVYPRDFREFKDDPNASNYPKYNVHNRIGVTSNNSSIGNPNTTVDSINILTITPRATFYNLSNSATNNMNGSVISDIDVYSGIFDKNETRKKSNGKYARDICKFRIEIVNNDVPIATGADGGKALNTDVLAFRAYLENINDNLNSNWKEFYYMGRGEPFYVYENFKRDLTFTFVLFAHSAEEMPAIYTKLNYLMSSMAPDYNSKNQMRGNYSLLTIGDYIYQQPGVFTSMNITDHLTAPWEIGLDEPENRESGRGDAKQHEVPKYLKVNMTFKPIHNFLPKRNHRDGDHTATFITPNFRVGHKNRYLPQTEIISGGRSYSTLIDLPNSIKGQLQGSPFQIPPTTTPPFIGPARRS